MYEKEKQNEKQKEKEEKKEFPLGLPNLTDFN
jgi:hypothetical protein